MLTAVAFMVGATSCGEDIVIVDAGITLNLDNPFSFSSSEVYTDGLTDSELCEIFGKHFEAIGAEKNSNIRYLLRKQTDKQAFEQRVLEAAEASDAEIKSIYGDPVKVHGIYTRLGVTVSYTWGTESAKDIKTYTYKED
ncbi:MAG: hypothetical protein ACI30J_06050 [Paludibacteraceae bacterium]